MSINRKLSDERLRDDGRRDLDRAVIARALKRGSAYYLMRAESISDPATKKHFLRMGRACLINEEMNKRGE